MHTLQRESSAFVIEVGKGANRFITCRVMAVFAVYFDRAMSTVHLILDRGTSQYGSDPGNARHQQHHYGSFKPFGAWKRAS